MSWNWSNAKCRRGKSFVTWYNIAICAMPCINFSSKSKATNVSPKHILKLNTLDKIMQARKKSFCHVIVKNYSVQRFELVLKSCNFIKKRPQNSCFPVNIAKCLILLSKIICERLLFDFFNASLLHRRKGSRSRLYNGVRLQCLTRRSSFLFLSRHKRGPSLQPASKNLKRISLMNQLSFYIGYFWSY